MSVFETVARNVPGKSVHDLSHYKLFTCDMGQLIPVYAQDCVPGDVFKMSLQALLRAQPLVAPLMHPVHVRFHSFFVPYRILDEDFEEMISGGFDGLSSEVPPQWVPTTYNEGSLWDFFGFPIDIDVDGVYPLEFIRSAYNMIYNEYYLDENLQTEVALTNEDVKIVNWKKDYFTSALPWQQRGTAPTLPITGTTSAVWDSASFANVAGGISVNVYSDTTPGFILNGAQPVANALTEFNNNDVDLSSASPLSVSDLRDVVQLQRWLELNSRHGVRYTELIDGHFGIKGHDSRLQRPEYIGGSKSPIVFTEIIQVSETGATPQGNLAGHGITLNEGFIGSYRVREHGIIMTLMSIVPETMYSQGVDRQWIKKTKYDFYWPAFANLSEQEIYNGEICAVDADDTHNEGLFGYQGRYDEMRIGKSMVCSGMRHNAASSYDYWHLGRVFDSSSSGTAPDLNETFIQCVPRKDVFAAPSEPGFIVQHANYVKALRPIPIQAEPGLLDHI